jgi:hypothetical protein
MEKQDIIKSFLSPEAVTEAKTALKALLDARAAKFREDSSKFLAKSLFEMTFTPPGLKAGDACQYDGHECIIDRVDGDNLILKPIDADGDGGGNLYSVSKSDKKMTFNPPGLKEIPAGGKVGNGLYKDDSNKGMIFTPPGGAATANTK